MFEDGLATALSTGIGGGTTVATFTTAELSGLVSPGADEPVTIKLNAAIDGGDSGLNSQGFDIIYDVVSSTQTNGVADGRIVFTIVEAPAGTFTFTLLDQVDHDPLATGGGDSETTSLSLAGVFTATDFDGDSVVIDAGATVVINNDVPANNAETISKTVFEDGLATALSTGIGGGTTVATFTAAELSGLVSPGADEPVTIKLNAAIDGGDSGLNSKGFDIIYDVVNATQTNGVADGRIVFTIVEAPAGTFTFTLLDQVDHDPLATGGGDSETTSLSLAGVFTATDFDGDSVVIDAGATVVINNDIPANNAATIEKTVFEDGLATALSTGIGGGTTVATFTAAEIKTLVNTGADEDVTIKLNAAIDGGDSGLNSKGFDIIYDVVSSTQTNGVADGRIVFTIVEAPTGTFTFTLLDQVDHDPLATGGGDSETTNLSLAGVFTATDFDGDSIVIDAGATVVINNDIPANTAATVTGKVDEDSLNNLSGIFGSKGNLDAANDGITATGSIASLVSPGADENVTFSLSNITAGLTAQGLTSKGAALSYAVSGNTLTGFVNLGGGAGYDVGTDRPVFTLALSGLNFATYTFTLLDQLDHIGANLSGSGDDQIKTIDFSSVIVATDFDGDSITVDNGFTIQVEDDLPIFTSADHGTVANVAGISVIGDLITSVGADEPGTFGFGSNSASGLSSNGKDVFYEVVGNTLTAWADNDGSGGKTGGDTQVFQLVLNSDSTYTFTLLQPLDAVETVTIGSSTSFGSGPTAYQILTQDVVNTTPLAIISGNNTIDATKGINGSTSGWGVDNNQFGNNENIRLDFFDQDGPVGPGSFTGPRVAAASVDLLDYRNGDQLSYTIQYMNPDGTLNGAPVVVPVNVVGGGGNVDTHLTITAPAGLFIDYIDFHVISAQGEGGKFDLVSIQTFSNTGTLDLNFNVNLTDADNDVATNTIGITVDGSTGTITGTAANDAIVGDSKDNTITGLAGHDDIHGGAGNDTINGGDGNDKIIGGLGNDSLTGGNDSDTFVYQTLSDGKDSITDFNTNAPASGGDKLDVSAVLDLAGNTWADGGTVAAAVSGGYLTFTNDGTNHVQVNVDIDGAGGSAAVAVAVLTNVAFTNAGAAATALDDNIVVG